MGAVIDMYAANEHFYRAPISTVFISSYLPAFEKIRNKKIEAGV
jgi:hypothetical protein